MTLGLDPARRVCAGHARPDRWPSHAERRSAGVRFRRARRSGWSRCRSAAPHRCCPRPRPVVPARAVRRRSGRPVELVGPDQLQGRGAAGAFGATARTRMGVPVRMRNRPHVRGACERRAEEHEHRSDASATMTRSGRDMGVVFASIFRSPYPRGPFSDLPFLPSPLVPSSSAGCAQRPRAW